LLFAVFSKGAAPVGAAPFFMPFFGRESAGKKSQAFQRFISLFFLSLKNNHYLTVTYSVNPGFTALR
jgi:hypothetical protein